MTQTMRQSAVETIVGTAIGFFVSWATSLIVLPWFGFPIHSAPAFGLTTIYTVISLVRGMLVRRAFNRLHTRAAA